MLESNPNSVLPQELVAVILCGVGRKMYPLAEDLPKALLPLANQPMINYALEWIEKALIDQVVIIATQKDYSSIKKHCKEVFETHLTLTVVEVPDETETADQLRHIKSIVKGDFLVCSCDLVTDFLPQNILSTYRALNASMTSVFFESTLVEPPERPIKEEGEIVGIEDGTSRLLVTIPRSADGDLKLKRSLLMKFPNIHMHSLMRDAHIYIFKAWVLDLLIKTPKITSIKYQLVPLLLECQHRPSKVRSEGIDTLIQDSNTDLFIKARQLSLSGSTQLPAPSVSCIALLYRQGFSARATTSWIYAEINRVLIKNQTKSKADTAEVAPGSQVGPDSLVGESTSIAAKTSVKRTVVGNHVQIGKNCKIFNCVLMDYVVVEDGVKLESTILCKSSKVSAKSELKDCEVGQGFVVAPDTHARGEQLINPMSHSDED